MSLLRPAHRPNAPERRPEPDWPATAADLRLTAACAVAREAGKLALRHFRERPASLRIDFKGHQDYLAASDAEVEELIRQRLREAFPSDAFFGEEGGGELGDRVWIVDPVDGTANFLRGIPSFCVSIAFVREGSTDVGVIYDPLGDELFAAARGRGATLDGAPIRVSGLDEIRNATVEAGWSTRLPLTRYVELLGRLTERGAGARLRGRRPHRRLLRAAHERLGCAGRAYPCPGSRGLDQRLPGRIGPARGQPDPRLHPRAEGCSGRDHWHRLSWLDVAR